MTVIMKLRLKIRKRTNRDDINKPRPGHRHIHEYTRYKMCHSTMMIMMY